MESIYQESVILHSKTYEEMAVFDASEVKSVNINLSVSAIKIVKSEDENCNLYVEDGKHILLMHRQKIIY